MKATDPMSTNPKTPAGTAVSASNDVRQLEDMDLCPLDDITPYEPGSDMTTVRPCAYCGFTDAGSSCSCLDLDSPYGHITNRLGW